MGPFYLTLNTLNMLLFLGGEQSDAFPDTKSWVLEVILQFEYSIVLNSANVMSFPTWTVSFPKFFHCDLVMLQEILDSSNGLAPLIPTWIIFGSSILVPTFRPNIQNFKQNLWWTSPFNRAKSRKVVQKSIISKLPKNDVFREYYVFEITKHKRDILWKKNTSRWWLNHLFCKKVKWVHLPQFSRWKVR